MTEARDDAPFKSQLLSSRAEASGVTLDGLISLTNEQSDEIKRLTGLESRYLTFGSVKVGSVSISTLVVACC